jgi:DnaJ-domain-containing protein 1
VNGCNPYPGPTGCMAEAATADKMGGKADKADKAAELLQRISATEDYYEVLGVGRDADDAAIKLAYRKAALRLHPDKCQLPSSKEAFQKVSNAFGAS